MEKDKNIIEIQMPEGWEPGQELTQEELVHVFMQQINQLEEEEVLILMYLLLSGHKEGQVSFLNASAYACCAMLRFPKRVYEVLGRFYGKKKAKEIYGDWYEYTKNKENNETT